MNKILYELVIIQVCYKKHIYCYNLHITDKYIWFTHKDYPGKINYIELDGNILIYKIRKSCGYGYGWIKIYDFEKAGKEGLRLLPEYADINGED